MSFWFPQVEKSYPRSTDNKYSLLVPWAMIVASGSRDRCIWITHEHTHIFWVRTSTDIFFQPETFYLRIVSPRDGPCFYAFFTGFRRATTLTFPARPCWHSTYNWLDPRYSCPPPRSASSRSESSRSALGRSLARGRRPAAARTGSSRSTASEVLSPTHAQPVVDPRSGARMKSRVRNASAMDAATRA